jgi:hypothetical protein
MLFRYWVRHTNLISAVGISIEGISPTKNVLAGTCLREHNSIQHYSFGVIISCQWMTYNTDQALQTIVNTWYEVETFKPKQSENELKLVHRALSSSGCVAALISVTIAAFNKPSSALTLASLAGAIVSYSCSAWISAPSRMLVRIVHIVNLMVVLLLGWALLVMLQANRRSDSTLLPDIISCVRLQLCFIDFEVNGPSSLSGA